MAALNSLEEPAVDELELIDWWKRRRELEGTVYLFQEAHFPH